MQAASPQATAPRLRMPPVTRALLVLLVGVYGVQLAVGVDPMHPSGDDLMRWGALYGPRVAEGEWWRLGTASLLHGGGLHLAINAWMLSRLGPPLEHLFGWRAYSLTWVASALFASCASVGFQPAVLAVGASGAICGLFGAQFGWLHAHRRGLSERAKADIKRSLGLVVLLNVMIGFSIPNIDHAAHLGGLVSGFAIVRALIGRRPLGARPLPVSGRAVALCALGVLVCAAPLGWRLERSDAVRALAQVDLAWEAIEADELERGRSHLQRAVELAPEDPALHEQLGALELDLEQPERALAALRRALELDPTRERSLFLRGVGLLRLGEQRLARPALERARELAPEQAQTHAYLGLCELESKRPSAAMESLERALQLDPDYAWAHYLLGQAREELGLTDLALSSFERALELEPEMEEARERIDALGSMR